MWAIFKTNWYLLCLFPTCFAKRKVREISICCRNCSHGSYSYFDLPLEDSIRYVMSADWDFMNFILTYRNIFCSWFDAKNNNNNKNNNKAFFRTFEHSSWSKTIYQSIAIWIAITKKVTFKLDLDIRKINLFLIFQKGKTGKDISKFPNTYCFYQRNFPLNKNTPRDRHFVIHIKDFS